ncbi:homoserine O-acetyltransferase MetX [Alicyclobacillus kakegawensis]|uniref:homoserine O-acetyltransferase MetX n=1 Tax=Alicyclobacillus kakegawensis TaxID=392012 RepID=UPI001FE0FE0B|nr:homoserine O-acetyltransferase [Alicyclobacillus kakegawensis]
MSEKQRGLVTEAEEGDCRRQDIEQTRKDGMATNGLRHQAGVVTLPEFTFECGRTLEQVRIAFETWGQLSPQGDNVVVVCHALTGDAHAAAGSEGAAGWWDGLIGPGRLLDTRRCFVVCSNVLGGCSGSSGPASAGPDGRPYALTFPLVTVRDMVRAQMRLLDELGVRKVRLVIGGSLGGMQAWEWPLLDPERVERAVVIAADAHFSALAIGYNEVMRQAIVGDPAWCRGNYYGTGVRPSHGLGLARALAMLTYRSDVLFESRFHRRRVLERESECVPAPFPEPSWTPQAQALAAFTEPQFQVESYLRHHAQKLDARFDANSYLYLTRAMDSHDIGRGRGGLTAALAQLRARVTVIGIDTDYLYPVSALESTAQAATAAGAWVDLKVFRSDFGHDAFLAETQRLAEVLKGVWPG